MYPDPGVDALLFELEKRRGRAAEHRLAHLCEPNQVRYAGRARRACGGALVRFGAFLSGDAGLPEARELT